MGLETLTPRFTNFFTDFEKKTGCFADYSVLSVSTQSVSSLLRNLGYEFLMTVLIRSITVRRVKVCLRPSLECVFVKVKQNGDQYYGEIKAQLSAKRLYIKINVERSEPPEKKSRGGVVGGTGCPFKLICCCYKNASINGFPLAKNELILSPKAECGVFSTFRQRNSLKFLRFFLAL